ncbi:hypothetical protein Plim_1518 [Planctopirus limnophila DSM 3776]|uniref:Uncharacterized protein n=1 Tax=Planctopirus limnophila (strain ATCC 43296 / DSM 3776 / IFAM 1008 / Mu 290) TaxID=521674 RepID=D5SW66_PLAL2|nr:hypothetical protein [Planctopirus limnophila]ADG67351.1 hypothetical protein Plim_1518 [Planctopirus limnophila DSM 3776]
MCNRSVFVRFQLVLLVFVASVSDLSASQKSGRDLAESFWRIVDAAVDPSGYDKDPVKYSSDLFMFSDLMFIPEKGVMWRIYTESIGDDRQLEDEFVGELVSVFAKKSPQEDFRWFFSLEEYATPWGGNFGIVGSEGTNIRSFSVLLAKHLAYAFVDDHKVLVRYQHAMAWRHTYIRGSYIPIAPHFSDARFTRQLEDMAKRFKDGDPLYWWDVRNFIVMAYSTTGSEHLPMSREDLKQSVEKFRSWGRHFGSRGQFLRPSPVAPVWRLDSDLEKTGYGFVLFFDGSHVLPDLEYVPTRPFLDGPNVRIPNVTGLVMMKN